VLIFKLVVILGLRTFLQNEEIGVPKHSRIMGRWFNTYIILTGPERSCDSSIGGYPVVSVVIP